MKTDLDEALLVDIGGVGLDKTFAVRRVELPARKRISVGSDWHALSYLSTPAVPDAAVGAYSSALDETLLIAAHQWGNIWVYGMEIILAGYITRGEFRRAAKRIPAGTAVFQYPLTRTDNFAIPMGGLYPLPDLFGRAKNWAQKYR